MCSAERKFAVMYVGKTFAAFSKIKHCVFFLNEDLLYNRRICVLLSYYHCYEFEAHRTNSFYLFALMLLRKPPFGRKPYRLRPTYIGNSQPHDDGRAVRQSRDDEHNKSPIGTVNNFDTSSANRLVRFNIVTDSKTKYIIL